MVNIVRGGQPGGLNWSISLEITNPHGKMDKLGKYLDTWGDEFRQGRA